METLLDGELQMAVEEALQEFTNDRLVNPDDPAGKILAHPISELDFLTNQLPVQPEMWSDRERAESYFKMREILTRIRHRAFAKLCAWERQLS